VKRNVIFKEWAPDQPDLGAEVLVNAQNVIPSASGYKCFKTFAATSTTAPATVIENAYAANSPSKGTNIVYVSAGDYYTSANFGPFTSRGGATLGAEGGMVQFDDLFIAVGEGHVPYKHTIGSTSNVSTLAATGTAPACNVVGVINRFVVLGDLLTSTLASTQRANVLQWCAIDQPTNWPEPNSATAIATQAGQQILESRYGQIMGIHGGDQFGVVLQVGAVTRMTYEQPPTVFRFDVLDNINGSLFKKGSIQAGGLTYWISRNGFCRSDGVNVERIGVGKVDKFFWDSVNQSFADDSLNTGYDPLNNLVQWAFPTAAGTTCNRLMSFNPDTAQWSYCDVALSHLVTPNKALASQQTMIALNSAFLGRMEGTAGSAVLETSDAEFNPSGRSYVDAISPHVESSGTAPAMTVRLGYRDSLGTTPSYTSATSANSATGEANFRIDAKYVRAEITLTGNFEKATGFVAEVKPAGLR
jgi:hypothetical protein